MLILDEEEVRALLSYEQLIPVIRQALIDFSAGRVQQPVRAIIPVPRTAAGSASCPRCTAR
jgi:ornithine cyclodeaminase/alanine dehydrogenase-like protein (mu-crystallin family)